ncbi:ER membrane protein complex subunit 7 homolog [Teleopsis dalmanni]|uniref:ER membrane protein complex subunit 7 homolog n=1 Tax=Teleopsis dalmanni TaxID=139649 RepID=UPI0018CF1A54|nr:ER membrane protein complex subunit 7 homolog [Teleopsis dalmanni]XP_037952925.1 ER membrane protein complex subunit 7 homolog [Teleopsis dalmanni]
MGNLKKGAVFVCSCLFIISIGRAELIISSQDELIDSNEVSDTFTIEGKVYPPDMAGALYNNKWLANTTISISGGEYKGFLRDDGSFIVSSVPSGSFVLEVHNPDYFYEPVRVEINPKGKYRARKVNYVQPSQVIQVPYPLKLKALTRFKYFQAREQWKITDFLFNPMVLMMVLPLLLMLVLPKMISDPETKKEIDNMQIPKMGNELPEISELIASLFSDKQPEKKQTNKQTKKRN